MAHPRKFRFGVQLSTAPSGEEWTKVARRAEDLEKRRARWDVSYLVVQGDAMESMAPVVAKLAGS
jgi:hypothetical protein